MTKQHPSWEGIVPCFESGQEYLDWIQNWMEWGGSVPEDYEAYFLELGSTVRHYGYERPIPEKKMCKALERSQRTGEMIDIVPDPEFLPGGARANQCDGWTYHIELLSKEEYFKRRQEQEDMINRDNS
jgi:hypothetical protein